MDNEDDTLVSVKSRGVQKMFQVDKVFGSTSSQEEVGFLLLI